MIVSWACELKTLVRLEDGGTIRIFPPLDVLPDWQRISAAVEAGTVTIADYAPPPAAPAANPAI